MVRSSSSGQFAGKLMGKTQASTRRGLASLAVTVPWYIFLYCMFLDMIRRSFPGERG